MQNHFPITHEFHPQIAPNFVLYLNSSHGNWIYMMTTVVVVVVVVVMHASKNKTKFWPSMILLKISSNLCIFFELENMIFDKYGGFFFWVKKWPEFSNFQEIIIINCQISIIISSRLPKYKRILTPFFSIYTFHIWSIANLGKSSCWWSPVWLHQKIGEKIHTHTYTLISSC